MDLAEALRGCRKCFGPWQFSLTLPCWAAEVLLIPVSEVGEAGTELRSLQLGAWRAGKGSGQFVAFPSPGWLSLSGVLLR